MPILITETSQQYHHERQYLEPHNEKNEGKPTEKKQEDEAQWVPAAAQPCAASTAGPNWVI